MSSDPVGGYTLFSSTLSRADLIAVTMKAMELGPDEFLVRLAEDGFPRFSHEGYPFRTEEPPDRALTLLAQEESGVIEGQGPKSAETYWFEPAAASNPVVTVWIEESALRYDERPKEVEHFVERWLQLCEQGQAVFGYICPFDFMFEREHLEEKILPAYQDSKVWHLLEQMTPSWLIYLGPELAERWREEQCPSPSPLQISQELPSGAQFLRTSLGIAESSLSVLRP
jgi:hypothetical protein